MSDSSAVMGRAPDPGAAATSVEGGVASLASRGVRTLAIDIGGTGLKASVLDVNGSMLLARRRIETPHPCPPATMLRVLGELVAPLEPFDRISVGFPGVVRNGLTLTAPHLDTERWRGFDLEGEISRAFGRPARVTNDAEVQGLGIIDGKGLEVVLTLGTGLGSAIFFDGNPCPHLELAHHPIHKDKTYDEYVGKAAREKKGDRKWSRRVRRMIDIVASLTQFDRLYLGGSNASSVTCDLPDNVRIASNDTGITGGIHLWDESIWTALRGRTRLVPARRRPDEAD